LQQGSSLRAHPRRQSAVRFEHAATASGSMHSKSLLLHPAPSALPQRTLRWFSDRAQFTQIGHVPGGRRPLLREGGPISYEPRPSGLVCAVRFEYAAIASGSMHSRSLLLHPAPSALPQRFGSEVHSPPLSELGTYKTVRARFWTWLQGRKFLKHFKLSDSRSLILHPAPSALRHTRS